MGNEAGIEDPGGVIVGSASEGVDDGELSEAPSPLLSLLVETSYDDSNEEPVVGTALVLLAAIVGSAGVSMCVGGGVLCDKVRIKVEPVESVIWRTEIVLTMTTTSSDSDSGLSRLSGASSSF